MAKTKAKTKAKVAPKREQRVTGIMITRTQLESYKVVGDNYVGEEVRLPIANVSDQMPLQNREGENVLSTREGTEGQQLFKNIINLKAIAPHNIEAIRETFKDKEEVDLGELDGLLMSANTRPYIDGNEPQLPMFGGSIIAHIEKVETGSDAQANGSPEWIVAVQSFALPEVKKASNFSLESEDALKLPDDDTPDS